MSPQERSEAAREAALTRWHGALHCVGAHDRCYGGTSAPCPYCERSKPDEAPHA